MILSTVSFYLFAAIIIGSAVMVVGSRNPVYSVFFLILAFFNAAGLFVIAGAEFLAMILVIVYVGAVAVLFMFVVMMLDINFVRLREGFLQYLPIGALVGIILLIELVFVFAAQMNVPGVISIGSAPVPPVDRNHQYPRAGTINLHAIYLLVPSWRSNSLSRDDRRYCPYPSGAPGS